MIPLTHEVFEEIEKLKGLMTLEIKVIKKNVERKTIEILIKVLIKTIYFLFKKIKN